MTLSIEVLINAANILYLFAFMVRDILWLRILTVIASILLIVYFLYLPTPLLTAVYWNLAFTVLSIYWIVRLLLERRPVKLTDDEQMLCELVFGTMTPREMIALLKIATWEDVAANTCFVNKGTPLDRLMVIFSGRSCVEVDGKYVT